MVCEGLYLGFFVFVHNFWERGKALLQLRP